MEIYFSNNRAKLDKKGIKIRPPFKNVLDIFSGTEKFGPVWSH
jgi:hypothetical protein